MADSPKRLQTILPGTNITPEVPQVDRMKRRVCRIECPRGVARGTGFLIGPDLVLTNFHVKKAIGEPRAAVFRFDYETTDQHTIDATPEYTLANSHWCLAESPYSELDLKSDSSAEPGLDTLDYSLLKLSSKPAYDQIGGTVSLPVFRGWVDPPTKKYEFRENESLAILHHPIGAPLAHAREGASVISVTTNGSRVRHRTWTLPGSSGSPCFNESWTWVALHQSGDPAFVHPSYNQAIPSWSIVADLAAKNVSLGPYEDESWGVTIERPVKIDFRGRGDPGEGNWKADALMISLEPMCILVDIRAKRAVRLKRSTIRLPQFPYGRTFRWGWIVKLNEGGRGFLGHVDDVHQTTLEPGVAFSREVMYRPLNEENFITWSDFVDTLMNFTETKLRVEVRYEFDNGNLDISYEIATSEILMCLKIGFGNERKFPKFIQPKTL